MHRALTTRTGALTLAIILAAAAALMVFVYVKGYQSDVNGRGTEVSVLVANQTIPQLTPGNQVVEATMYRTTTVPKSSLVDGAVTNPDQLKGLVARNDVYPGEQLTTNQFVKSDTNSVAVNLKPNQRAIDFPAEPGQGLVGRLQVGDHVDVVANFEVVPIDPATGLPRQGGQSIPVTKTIAKDVLVLGVPDTSDSSTSATQAKDAGADAGHQCQRRSARGVRAAEGRHLLRPPPAWQLRRCPARDRRRPQRASRHQRRPAPVHHSGQGALT